MTRALIIFLMLVGPAFAQDRVPFDCTLPELSGLGECSRFTRPGGGSITKWRACGGDCMVENDENGSSITSTLDGAITRLDGLQFLHGYKPTVCLQTDLPFIRDDGTFYLVSVEGTEPAEPRALDLPKARVAPYEGFLACDRKTLFYNYEDVLSAIDIETGKSAFPDGLSEYDHVYEISQDGRYLQIAGFDNISVWDRLTDNRIETPAVFELDHIKFDIDIDHMMIFPHDKSDVYIYRLPEGSLVDEVPRSSIGRFTDIKETDQGVEIIVYEDRP